MEYKKFIEDAIVFSDEMKIDLNNTSPYYYYIAKLAGIKNPINMFIRFTKYSINVRIKTLYKSSMVTLALNESGDIFYGDVCVGNKIKEYCHKKLQEWQEIIYILILNNLIHEV